MCPCLLRALVPVLLLTANPAPGAVFCVETASQLHNALAIAGSNNQHDSILLTAGTFSRSAGFALTINDGHGVEISGGWRPFLGNPCSHAEPDPWLSRIDGQAQRQGLSVLLSSHAHLRIRNLTLQNGQAVNGGGMEITAQMGNPGGVLLERLVFINNFAGNDGGGLLLGSAGIAVVSNNLFINNSGGGQAGAARYLGPAPARVIGNTVAWNRAFGPGAIDGLYLGGNGGIVANNLLWANGEPDGRDLLLGNTDFVLLHNNYGSLWGLPPAAGSMLNQSEDPQFLGGCGNVRLGAQSPMINAGMIPSGADDWVLPPLDLDGHSRVLSGSPDIGAFELETLFRDGFEGPSPCPPPL